MKLSDFAMSVLKNFATINSGVVLQPGKVQKTMSPEKSILVEAEFEDALPCQFGIYDLNQFLGNVSTLDNPDLDFSEKVLSMKNDTFTLNYFSCSPELIITPPNKELVIKEPDVIFELSNAVLTKLLRIAAMNSLPNLSIVGKDGELTLVVNDRSNDLSNSATAKLGDWSGDDFIATFKTENLKLIPDDYTAELKLNGFTKFKSTTRKLTYFVALEQK